MEHVGGRKKQGGWTSTWLGVEKNTSPSGSRVRPQTLCHADSVVSSSIWYGGIPSSSRERQHASSDAMARSVHIPLKHDSNREPPIHQPHKSSCISSLGPGVPAQGWSQRLLFHLVQQGWRRPPRSTYCTSVLVWFLKT